MDKPILITGATGFIGRHLLDVLLDLCQPIYCLTNNRSLHKQSEYIREIPFDILGAKPHELDALMSEIKPFYLFHTAWYTSNNDYLTSSKNLDWLESSRLLITKFYESGGYKCISLGSCLEHYFDEGSINDNTNKLNGSTLYAECKIKLSQYIANVASKFVKPYTWARVFFVYGPHDRPNRIIDYIYRNLMQEHGVQPHYGSLMRDYIYVKDLALQIKKLAINDYSGILDLGTGKAVSIQSIFNQVGSALKLDHLIGSNSKIDSSQPILIEADTSIYTKEIGELDIHTLEEGIEETMQWLSSQARTP